MLTINILSKSQWTILIILALNEKGELVDMFLQIFAKCTLISQWCPKSSVLSPQLFIIFINELRSAAIHRVTKFNTLLIILISPLQVNHLKKIINHDLGLINKWLRANKISLNTTKREIIIFHTKNKRTKISISTFKLVGKK